MTIPESPISENISLGAAKRLDSSSVARPYLKLAMPINLKWAMRIKGEMMRLSKSISDLHFSSASPTGPLKERADQTGKEPAGTMMHWATLLVLVTATLSASPVLARSQSVLSSEDPPATSGITAPANLDQNYVRPTERTKVKNYAFDAFGPYPFVGAGVAAGINQWNNSPPDWGQGATGFGKRFGSDFGIAAIGTSTRYGLAEAFREDTSYYRCECRGPLPRLRHAVISTFTGRHGEDGHRVFSISALAAPYAGSMIAVHAWYPDRYGAKDAFRMGNYTLLANLGGNIALEFLYSGPHALMSRLHLNNPHGSTTQGQN